MYIFRRGGRYWFRKACPLDLASVLGAEIRCSLCTEERAVARRRAWALLIALEEVYEVLRSERPLEPARALLGAFVDDFRQNAAGTPEGHFRASVGLQTAAIALGVPALPLPAGDGQTLVAVDDIDPLLQREQPRSEVNRTASDLLRLAVAIRREKSWSRPQRAKALVALCQKLAVASDTKPLDSPGGLDAVRSIIREEVSRLGAGTTINQGPEFDHEKLREIVAGEVRAGVAAAGRDRWSDAKLSKMIDEYLSLKGEKRQVGLKHKEDVARRLKAFLNFVGDKEVRKVTRDDIKTYRDVLDQLPDRFEARFKTKDMRLAIQKNAEFKPERQVTNIGPITVDLKWLGPVNRLMKWLVIEEKIEKNPCDGVRSTQTDGEAANAKRLPFKPDQISKIFAITSNASPKTALYWLPLLLLATGARPNELAQLRTDDIKEFNGAPHLSVLCLPDDDDKSAKIVDKAAEEENQQQVKTAAGRRMIPLHPILIEAGFIRFVEERHNGAGKSLFRELHPNRHGHWSAAITKRINRIIRLDVKITNHKYSTYSFRHYFIDACRKAGIDEEVRMKFMGHQIEGPQGIYGNPLVLPHESSLMANIKFADIDFGAYPVSAA